jgi:hypothetical protein
MNRFFNTTGPCDPADHYMLQPLARLPELRRLIAERRYYVIHAARQTGKTTAVRALAEELRAEGQIALYASLETSRHAPELAQAEQRWLQAIYDAAEVSLPEGERPEPPSAIVQADGTRLQGQLRRWAMRVHPRPIILFLDEADTIEGPALISFLAQLRAGFNERPRAFPSSVALVGLRDLKDYLTEAKGGLPPNPGSPFNIKAESITLRNFTAEEVAELYAQHTEATGQAFTPAACERAFYWTNGQPFLVNALAYHLTSREPVPLDQPIDAPDIERAKAHLALARTTHLSNLEQRLHEPRVARVVRAVLLGERAESLGDNPDDLDYCIDLGLIRRANDGYEASTPVYREVLTRTLTRPVERHLAAPWWPWKRPDGRLDFPALIDAFFAWWREHGDTLVAESDENWREAAAHLAFLGFLQRVVNGGGTVEREFSTGRGALDVLVRFGDERFAVELKRVRPRHEALERVRERGEAQLVRYLDVLGLEQGWLLVFDQRPGLSWEERLWSAEVERGGKRIFARGG